MGVETYKLTGHSRVAGMEKAGWHTAKNLSAEAITKSTKMSLTLLTIHTVHKTYEVANQIPISIPAIFVRAFCSSSTF